MSGIARSQVLIAHLSTGNEYSPAFTCPSGHVTLAKAAHLTNQTAAVIRCTATVGPTSSGQNVNLFDINLAAGASFYWAGWAAVNPGQYLAIYTAAAGIAEWVSGAVLSGAPQFPIAGSSVELLGEPVLPIPPPGTPIDYPPTLFGD